MYIDRERFLAVLLLLIVGSYLGGIVVGYIMKSLDRYYCNSCRRPKHRRKVRRNETLILPRIFHRKIEQQSASARVDV